MKLVLVAMIAAVLASDCDRQPSSDERQQAEQERILQEGTSATGMPAVKNFRERRLMKDIIELRDQDGLVTYTYVFAEMSGKLQFFCNSIGYGLPYATQYTNPEKLVWGGHGDVSLPQADPNGLFSPVSAEGTWIMCKDPAGNDVRPVYVEPRVVVSPFKLQDEAAQQAAGTSKGKP